MTDVAGSMASPSRRRGRNTPLGDAFPSTESIVDCEPWRVNTLIWPARRITIIKQGGTNNIHGSRSVHQKRPSDAIPYTFPTTTTSEPYGNTYGGSFGGPV